MISKLVAYELRFRRPEGTGADPKAGPGGEDYRSKTPVSEAVDCELPEKTLQKPSRSQTAPSRSAIDLQKVRACIESVKEPLTVKYLLRREAEPYLRLEEEENTPSCVRSLLAQIPVPREIFFQSDEEGPMLCYSSRLDVEADELFGAKIPTKRVWVKLELPPEQLPKDEKEMILYISSLSLAPYWEGGEKRTLRSYIVPKELCAACFGPKGVLPDDGRPQVYWP